MIGGTSKKANLPAHMHKKKKKEKKRKEPLQKKIAKNK